MNVEFALLIQWRVELTPNTTHFEELLLLDAMLAAILIQGRVSKIELRQSMGNVLQYIHAKLNGDPLRISRALGFFRKF